MLWNQHALNEELKRADKMQKQFINIAAHELGTPIQPGNMKKILIVDDEPDVCTVLKNVLEEYGFNADSYDDPISALQNFKAGLYELLLLDIKMPEMDGFLLYQEVKKIDNKIKVCFLTASEMYHEKFREKEGFYALDKDPFLRKPIENEDLIKEINRTLNTRRCKAGDKDSCRNRET